MNSKKDPKMKSTNDNVSINIRFVNTQKKYTLPDSTMLVPGSMVAKDLNTMLNKILKESDNIQDQVEFDFLIYSHFLRTSLLEHFVDQGISTENVVDVEYIEKYPPPEPKDCLKHDEWVSAVAVCGVWILTGCYDCMLNIWTLEGKHKITIPGHKMPIKAVAWISVNNDNATFVSASLNSQCMIWSWDIIKNFVKCIHICEGLTRNLEVLDINQDKMLIAGGGWNKKLFIWSSTQNEDDSEEYKSKKAKLKNAKKCESLKLKCEMEGHKQAIFGLVWSDQTEIITGSWDNTIKIWDTELNGMKREIYAGYQIYDIDYSSLSRAVIAGSTDQHVKLYDPRSTEGAIAKITFTSHKNCVASVRWSKVNEYLFISGAYDNIVKFWDTRSPKAPLFDLLGHEDKVLSCDWSNPELIMSGSADCTLKIFKSNQP